MATVQTIEQITNILRESSLSWLLPNLRQDIVVWNSLNDPEFLEKLSLFKPVKSPFLPEQLSPGILALVALDQFGPFDKDKTNILDAVESHVLQSAIRNFDDHSLFRRNIQDLATAGSIALALADKISSKKSWKGLLDLLQENPGSHWLAPIACLYSYIEPHEQLLQILAQPGADAIRFELAVHTLLSNPLSSEEQLSSVGRVFYSDYGDPLPAQDRIKLIRALSEQRPQTAADFCTNWLDAHPEELDEIDNSNIDPMINFNNLAGCLFQEELIKISGHSHQVGDLVDIESEISQQVSFSLATHVASNTSQLESSGLSPQELTDIWDKAIQANQNTTTLETYSANQAELALQLVNHGLVEKAKNMLPWTDDPTINSAAILFAKAKIAYYLDDTLQARQLAKKVIDLLDKELISWNLQQAGQQFTQINFGKFLSKLSMPDEAVRVLEMALQACPNDASLLEFMSTCYRDAHRVQDAVVTNRELVALYPENLTYHRTFAGSLEAISDWEAAFKQRMMIVELNREHGNPIPVHDLTAYAHTALKAKYPESALNICGELLSQNQEDPQALIFSGEAYLQMNEPDKGMEFLTRATQVAPLSSNAWLALANAQKEINSSEIVIETLKNASQAVPDSAEIHFALGEVYLGENSPSLALPELQTAVEIAPDDPQILTVYGQVLKMLGYIDKSRASFSKAYSLDPNYPGLAQQYSKILLELGEFKEAISPLEVLITSKSILEPGPYLEYARCVLAMNKNGDTDISPMRALIALNEALQIDPELAEVKALTAEALAANGDNEMAYQAYHDALETPLIEDEQWRERLSYGFGCVAGSIGKHDVAIASLQEASQANPQRPEIFMALSDEYAAANLPEDALQAARNVLVIEGDNPNFLAWFARQIEHIASSEKSGITKSPIVVTKLVLSEALSALDKAIQIAPTRSDLLVQLGNFQAQAGMQNEAKTTFASLASHNFATIEDLMTSAGYLSGVGDYPAAIACLENGVSKDLHSNGQHNPSLYNRLALEHVNNLDHASALKTLEDAINLLPEENSFVFQKVEILLSIGKTLDALKCIDDAAKTSQSQPARFDLLFLGSLINRAVGDFDGAVKYAHMGLTNFWKSYTHHDLSQLPIKHRTQIAEIYRALIQPDLAYSFLQDGSNPTSADKEFDQDYVEYLCLRTELALDIGEQIPSDIQDVQVQSSDVIYPRITAIQARLVNKAGNYKSAEQLFRQAIDQFDDSEKSVAQTNWSSAFTGYLNEVSIAEAAIELGFWNQAAKYYQRIKVNHQQEPLSYLQLARAIIQKAEFYNLCESNEVISHRPSLESTSSEAFDQLQQYIGDAKSTLAPFQTDGLFSGIALTEIQIQRWQARASIAFNQHGDPTYKPGEILATFLTPGDTAALITDLRYQSTQRDNDDGDFLIVKAASNHPRNSDVILQLAMALKDTDPAETMRSLQIYLGQNPNAKSPSSAFCNYQLTRIAMDQAEYDVARAAIENAISFWPDEPGWHALAAKVFLQVSDTSGAIDHLTEATNLAPNSFTYHLELGNIFFRNASDGPTALNHALESFAYASSLEPNNVEALSSLASAQYQLNDLENSELNAHKVLDLSPERSDIYQLLSEIAIKRTDYHAAFEYANKAIQISPKDVHSTITLAHALCALGENDEALVRLNALIPTVPEAKLLHLERVNIIRKINGPRAGLNELISLAVSFPEDFNILNALAKAHLEVGEIESAVNIAQQALKSHTENTSRNEQANLHLLIGQAFRQAGQLDQAIQHLSEAIQLAPDRLEPYLELGLARKDRREYTQALQIFERATAIAPTDPRAPFQAGLALKESKDYKSSETMLRRAVSLAPNDLNIRRQLAAVVALNLVHNPRSGRN